jgi:hypothetical protein
LPGISLTKALNNQIPMSWCRRSLAVLIFLFLLALSLFSQIRFTVAPFLRNYSLIFSSLGKDDYSLLQEAAPDLASVVAAINSYPLDTRFYFAPCFKDSKNTAIDWWYAYVLTRYFCFTRKIFCLHPVLYGDSKEEYYQKFINGKEHYADLPWIISRGISHVIVMRSNIISVHQLSDRIEL